MRSIVLLMRYWLTTILPKKLQRILIWIYFAKPKWNGKETLVGSNCCTNLFLLRLKLLMKRQRKYHQILKLTAKRTSLLVRIQVRTSQHYIYQYKIKNEMVIYTSIMKKAHGCLPTLTDKHTMFLIDYYTKNMDAVLFEV